MVSAARSDGYIARSIGSLAGATARLNAAVDALDPAASARPSLLPDWTVGHVLTHLARNADAQRNLLHWAQSGIETPMYRSPAARIADIQAGAARPGAEIFTDYRASAAALAEVITALPMSAWAALVRTSRGGPTQAAVVLHQRLAEVELHHHDLGIDAGLALLDDDAGMRLLSAIMHSFVRVAQVPPLILEPYGCGQITIGGGGQRVAGTAAELAGWLTGRTGGANLRSTHPLPRLPGW